MPRSGALAEELGIAARVTLAGGVPARRWKPPARADIFASAWWEGYGMAVAEAIARGLPLAIREGGALAELMPREAGVVSFPGEHDSLSRALRRVIYDDRCVPHVGGLLEGRAESSPMGGPRRWLRGGIGSGGKCLRASTTTGSRCENLPTLEPATRDWQQRWRWHFLCDLGCSTWVPAQDRCSVGLPPAWGVPKPGLYATAT